MATVAMETGKKIKVLKMQQILISRYMYMLINRSSWKFGWLCVCASKNMQ